MPEMETQNSLKAVILDAAPAIIAMQDTDHNILWANKAYLKASGRSLQEIEGKKCYTIWGQARPCKNCPVAAAIETGRQQQAEITMKDGEHLPYDQNDWLVKASPVKESEGGIVGSVETLIETTRHSHQVERYEKTMAALMRLLEKTVNHTSSDLLRMFLDEAEALTESRIGFYHFVESDQLTLSLQMWSTNTLKTCTAPGAGTHYLIQQAGVWVDCVHTGAPVIHNDYAALPHKKGLPEGHAPVIRELVVPVIRGGKLLAILGVGNKEQDYDENDVWIVEQLAGMAWEAIVRKRTEEENRKLQEQFEQAQKMESIGRLAGGVAHDFNNMLSLITGYAEMAMEKAAPEGSLQDDLQEIMSAARRSADITRQLLAFARQQTIAPVVLDLNETVNGMLKMLRRLIGENIDLVWHPGAELWSVKIDPLQIDQILANLCVNARDAIADVGKVIIETRNALFDEDYCSSHAGFIPGEYVLITVNDNGCGMEKEMLHKIFEPFFTTKKLGQGTGLGLAMVYGIVRQNGGFINVYSEPGKGTNFNIYLTRHTGGAEKAPGRSSPEILYGKGEAILVVEDDPSLLNLTKKILERLGYAVFTAGTPVDALHMAKEQIDRIDLLITDVIMPEMNGRDLAERMQAQYPSVKCLFMSGYTADVIAHHGVLDDGVNFIQKPFSKKDFAAKIREVLDKGA